MKSMQEKMEALKKPFKHTEIEWMLTAIAQDKQKGLAVAFVSNRAIQNRLDEVFGLDGWKNEYKPWKDYIEKDNRVSSQLCGISIYDDEKKEWITRWDGAADTDIEPIKGGLSASMKRAAGMFGIGRYLYDIEGVWVNIEPAGRSYRIAKGCTPALPAWALPDGDKNPTTTQPPIPQQPQQETNPQQQAVTSPPQRKNSSGKLSERQIYRAIAKGRHAGADEKGVRINANDSYKKNLEDLTYEEYDELCRYLDSLAAINR